ncbi:hypothetical protein [Paraburkholderia bryophila]|uniref:Uncharacterized protein n=1 Tax=Paraburkholderia bryophila TaxID=420952 RepID=A0A7Z0B5R7_9BURK|nr:hypothetical protein [Paraburkholderia bryophila]NYH21363.1 hypothetical protein [Paraburkholderia bryophila]
MEQRRVGGTGALRRGRYCSELFGDAEVKTSGVENQRRLPKQKRRCDFSQRRSSNYLLLEFFGVADGARTHDNRNHNPCAVSLQNNNIECFGGIPYGGKPMLGMVGFPHLPRFLRLNGPVYTVHPYSILTAIMRHRPPLTAAELAEIYDREPTEAVLQLLREIHRLRSTIRRADQIRKMIGSGGHSAVASTVWECFERELDAEPCLTDPPTARQQKIHDERMRMLDVWRRNGRKG